MELTSNRNTIPPRVIDYTEAARCLMDKQHLGLVGADDIPIHQRIFAQLTELLPCAITSCQAQCRSTPGPDRHVITRPIPHGRNFILLFTTDNAAARLATVVTVLPMMAPQRRVEMVKKLAAMTEPPIVFLESPERSGDPALWQGYTIIASGLQAVAEGRATDVSLN